MDSLVFSIYGSILSVNRDSFTFVCSLDAFYFIFLAYCKKLNVEVARVDIILFPVLGGEY